MSIRRHLSDKNAFSTWSSIHVAVVRWCFGTMRRTFWIGKPWEWKDESSINGDHSIDFLWLKHGETINITRIFLSCGRHDGLCLYNCYGIDRRKWKWKKNVNEQNSVDKISPIIKFYGIDIIRDSSLIMFSWINTATAPPVVIWQQRIRYFRFSFQMYTLKEEGI